MLARCFQCPKYIRYAIPFTKNNLVKIDYLYYLKALVNPLDQVLDVAFGEDKKYKKGMVMDQYKFRWKIRAKLLEELKDLFRPKLKFEK